MKKADGVFEGGGIKGIGLVVTITVAEQLGENYSDTIERYKPSRLNLTEEEKQELFESGQQGARRLFQSWNFEEYKKKSRE